MAQQFIAFALYDPERFSSILQDTANNYANEILDKTKEHGSRRYRLSKRRKVFFHNVKNKVGLPTNLRKDYNDGSREEKMIRALRTLNESYHEMSTLVNRIGEEHKNAGIEKIMQLAELNHILSGQLNGTGLNVTFTDEDMRSYGTQLQQLIYRVYVVDIHPESTPLTESQLFPVTAKGTF